MLCCPLLSSPLLKCIISTRALALFVDDNNNNGDWCGSPVALSRSSTDMMPCTVCTTASRLLRCDANAMRHLLRASERAQRAHPFPVCCVSLLRSSGFEVPAKLWLRYGMWILSLDRQTGTYLVMCFISFLSSSFACLSYVFYFSFIVLKPSCLALCEYLRLPELMMSCVSPFPLTPHSHHPASLHLTHPPTHTLTINLPTEFALR